MDKINRKTILGLVAKYRMGGDYTTHEYSKGYCEKPIPCTDVEVAEFISDLHAGVDMVCLIISDIGWKLYEDRPGDELYPVRLSAIRLPDGRYSVRLTGDFKTQEYILEL